MRPRTAALLASIAAMLSFVPAQAEANANTAALQAALKALHHYDGSIDGISGPATRRAVRRFQRRHRLPVTGAAGPRTRRALGSRGRPRLGSRVIRLGHRGWDVAAVQFMLRRRGFRAGRIDGGFGRRTQAGLRRFQRSRRLGVDGRAGPGTLRALRHRRARHRRRRAGRAPGGAVVFFRPVRGSIGDGFGYRYGRKHTGIDFPVPAGRRVGAGGRGVVTFAGWNVGGYGNLVVIRHRRGFESWYAHLSQVTSFVGERVVGGTRIGYVGSTGRSTGPHLHFEVRLRRNPIDPLPRMLAGTASAARSSLLRLECTASVGVGPAVETTSGPARALLAPCPD